MIRNEKIDNLLQELNKLHHRKELSQSITPDYFEPGMMEYLDQSEGLYDEFTGEILVRFEVKGTRYAGRTEQIEKVRTQDSVKVVRDPENEYNTNNFALHTQRDKDLGNMPAELCNAIAPLYDSEELTITGATVSYVEPISKRSRHAKRAILFVELQASVARVL